MRHHRSAIKCNNSTKCPSYISSHWVHIPIGPIDQQMLFEQRTQMGHEKCGYRKHLKIPKNTFESHLVHVDRVHAGGCNVIISSESLPPQSLLFSHLYCKICSRESVYKDSQ